MAALCLSDEIADMPREPEQDPAVLVDQTFQRSGGTAKVNVDVASSPRRAESGRRIAEGRFREDSIIGGRWCRPRAAAVGAARRYSELIDYFMDQISLATGLPKRQIGRMRWRYCSPHCLAPEMSGSFANNVERA